MELIECIRRIPSLINQIINNNQHSYRKLNDYLEGKDIDELIFIASGTSMTASAVTKYFAYNKLNIKTAFIYPNLFLNSYEYINPKGLYVFISQGGSTKQVYEALCKVKQLSLPNISITENIDSPIALQADCSIEMGSVHEEFMYRTIGYSCTSTTCYLLELNFAFIKNKISSIQFNEFVSDLQQVTLNLEVIRNTTLDWYEKNRFSLLKRSKCLLAGTGYLYECSNEADIKIMEMVPMFARSFELEEFIHGPQNAFSDDIIFFILCDKENELEKIKSIKEFIRNEIGFCSVIGDSCFDDRDLCFKYMSKNFRSLEIITSFQVIAYCMARDRGRDLSRGVNVSVNKYIKKTL